MSSHLQSLIESYENSPAEFHATSYWEHYKTPVTKAVSTLDLNNYRSGTEKSDILRTFGFTEVVYPKTSGFKNKLKVLLWSFRQLFLRSETIHPYGQDLSDVRDVAIQLCELMAHVTKSRSIKDVSVNSAGNPNDYFKVGKQNYSMVFIEMYLRYCFVNQHVNISKGGGYRRIRNRFRASSRAFEKVIS